MAGRFLRSVAVLGTVLALSPTAIFASDTSRPFWTEQAMLRFGDDLLFVGQASCAASVEEGRQRAFLHAVQEFRNYSQASTAVPAIAETQMTYEEWNSRGCESGTVSVWRLVKMRGGRLTWRGEARSPNTLYTKPATQPPALWIGMTRDQVFDRLGRPSSLTLRRGNQLTWEYRRVGLIVEFDRQFLVAGWRPIGSAPSPETIGSSLAVTKPVQLPIDPNGR